LVTPNATSAAPAPQPVAPKPRKLSYKEQRELDSLPATIQRLEAEQAALTAAIADPELFRRNLAEANAAVARLQAVGKELEAAFARWEALEEPT
jgi:ATP-binding cassette subfamily F protein uup